MSSTPERRARELIDAALAAAGWVVQDRRGLNLHAAPGIALCETDVEGGFADYMLFVDAKAIGVLEAKAAGTIINLPHETRSSCPAGRTADSPDSPATRDTGL